MNRTFWVFAGVLSSSFLLAQNPKADTTAPVIEKIEFREPLEAGKPSKFFFKATDSGSGISGFKGSCSSLQPRNGGPTVSICGHVKSEGNDWYSIEVTPGEFAMNDHYVMSSFDITDKAGNQASYSGEPLRISVINNGKQDKTPPVVHEVKFDGKLEAGKTAKLLFRATDDVSGVTGFKGTCSSLHPKAGGPYITICGHVKKEQGDWYSMEVPVSEYAVGGEYTLNDFTLYDNAGNSNQGALSTPLVVSVDRKGSGDRTPPVVEDAWVNLGSCDAQGNRKAKFLFQAKDSQSGIAGFKGSCDSFKWHGGEAPSISVCNHVVQHKRDWYSIEFTIPATAPHGRYTMKGFTIYDKAGNLSAPLESPVTFLNISCEVDVTERNATGERQSH